MKKYIPSVLNNNELKNKALVELNNLVYQIEKGKISSNLDKNAVLEIVVGLKEEIQNFENSIGEGNENILSCYDRTMEDISQLKKDINQPLFSKLEESIEELIYSICLWKDVLNGNVEDIEDYQKNIKFNYAKRKLSKKIELLKTIKYDYQCHEERLEKEIKSIEKEVKELEEKMIEEDNERLLNEYYRRIQSSKNKIDSLNIRRSNYSVCFNLMDMIDIIIREIVLAGEYATGELNKAKSLLNMNRIKEMAINPEKAVPILKFIQEDIDSINKKTKAVDNKIFASIDSQSVIEQDALNYKEMLIKERREKELINKEKNQMEKSIPSSQLKTDKKSIKDGE